MPYENNSTEIIHWGFRVAREKAWNFSLTEYMKGLQENLETKTECLYHLFTYLFICWLINKFKWFVFLILKVTQLYFPTQKFRRKISPVDVVLQSFHSLNVDLPRFR